MITEILRCLFSMMLVGVVTTLILVELLVAVFLFAGIWGKL